MNLEWDGKVGPASIIGVLGFAGTIATIWFGLKADVSTALNNSTEAKAALTRVYEKSAERDKIIGDHSVSLGQIQTQLGYMTPALQRIEQKLDARQ